VNYFSHLWVAVRAGPIGPGESLGVVLPDVLSVSRTKVDTARLPPAVLDGRSLHHRSDRLFHAHADFVALVAVLRGALVTGGLDRGAAHAGAHAGIELLLDGTLPDGSVVALFTEGLAMAELVHPALAPSARDHFDDVVARVSQDRPSHLLDPSDVAQRLFRILGRRPRLAFPAGRIDDVADVLAEHRPAVAAGAGQLLASIARRLTQEEDRYPGGMAVGRWTSPGA
jgi:hypothetical protein